MKILEKVVVIGLTVVLLCCCGQAAGAEIKHLGMAGKDLLCVEVEDGTVDHTSNGEFGTITGAAFDKAAAENVSNFEITSSDDPAYSAPKNPTAVGRKANGSEFVKAGGWSYVPRFTHWIYLKLPSPIKDGAAYSLKISNAFGPRPITATLKADAKWRTSQSVHLTEVGFVPYSPKFGFLSCWAGTLGAQDLSHFSGKAFHLYSMKSKDTPAFSGTVKLRRRANEQGDDNYRSNYQKVDLYEMDFGAFQEEGSYVLSVEGLGCSYPFRIAKDAYKKAYKVSTKGLYYQRCGCVLLTKHAGKTWARKRCHHPKDGKDVQETSLKLTDVSMGYGKLNAFKELPARTTGKKLDYWGGWHDAGDFDRRAQHLKNAGQLLDIYTIFPKVFKDRDLNIPESGNRVPDIVDEALWCVDFFIRGMTAEGGVRGGIESEGHPPHSCSSWTDPLHLYAYKEEAHSSYSLAWCAAKAARALKASGNAGRAKAPRYIKAAEKAWDWAVKNDDPKFKDRKNAAAAELLAATGKAVYKDSFRETSIFSQNPDAPVWQHGKHDQVQGAFAYAFAVTPDKADAELQQTVRKAVIRYGDGALDQAGKRAFRFAGSRWRPLNWGLGASPDVQHAIHAYALTKDKKYADVIATSCAFTTGGNPTNLVYMTGLGKRPVTQILHTDSWHMADRQGLHEALPGLVPSGPIKFRKPSRGIHGFTQRSFFPQVKSWPPLESYAGNRYDPGQNEHTPNSMAPAIMAYGFMYAYGLQQE